MYPISCWSCRVFKVFLPSLQLIQLLSSSSLPCCLLVCTHYQLSFLNGFHENGQKTLFRLPPFFFWMKHKHSSEKENLACKLAPSLTTTLMPSCAQYAPLPSPPTLPFVWILSLSLSYRSCLLSAFVKQYNCNDRQTMARKKPSCLKSCLDPL